MKKWLLGICLFSVQSSILWAMNTQQPKLIGQDREIIGKSAIQLEAICEHMIGTLQNLLANKKLSNETEYKAGLDALYNEAHKISEKLYEKKAGTDEEIIQEDGGARDFLVRIVDMIYKDCELLKEKYQDFTKGPISEENKDILQKMIKEHYQFDSEAYPKSTRYSVFHIKFLYSDDIKINMLALKQMKYKDEWDKSYYRLNPVSDALWQEKRWTSVAPKSPQQSQTPAQTPPTPPTPQPAQTPQQPAPTTPPTVASPTPTTTTPAGGLTPPPSITKSEEEKNPQTPVVTPPSTPTPETTPTDPKKNKTGSFFSNHWGKIAIGATAFVGIIGTTITIVVTQIQKNKKKKMQLTEGEEANLPSSVIEVAA